LIGGRIPTEGRFLIFRIPNQRIKWEQALNIALASYIEARNFSVKRPHGWRGLAGSGSVGKPGKLPRLLWPKPKCGPTTLGGTDFARSSSAPQGSKAGGVWFWGGMVRPEEGPAAKSVMGCFSPGLKDFALSGFPFFANTSGKRSPIWEKGPRQVRPPAGRPPAWPSRRATDNGKKFRGLAGPRHPSKHCLARAMGMA